MERKSTETKKEREKEVLDLGLKTDSIYVSENGKNTIKKALTTQRMLLADTF